MGGLLIKNKELRCKDCFKLYSMKIKPEFPTCKISRTCKCSTTEIEIPKFLEEYRKNKNLSIACAQCKKTNPKEPKFCHNCQKLYCINCCKTVHNEKNNNMDHKLIVIEKYDFFCVFHQNENFCAYCKTCKLDLCIKCGSEKLHEGHKILLYHKIYDEKKMREYLKSAIKSAEVKIDYNSKLYQIIIKEIKKNEISKNLKILNEISEDENKKILELINIFYELYDLSKPKNYVIIMNLLDNIHFNLERIKFEKNSTKEKDVQSLINYFKTDFILEVKGKKEKALTTLEEQLNNNQLENDKKEEKKEANGEKKEENGDKKEENVEKKEENEEDKKEEEKKEENEEEKEEEKKEEHDDVHKKTLKEKKAIIEKKIGEQGGFQKAQAIATNNKNNDIINAPKGSPDEVIKIISGQTINKKAKKKPKKITFQNQE